MKTLIHSIDGTPYYLSVQISKGSYDYETDGEFTEATYYLSNGPVDTSGITDSSSFLAYGTELPAKFGLDMDKTITTSNGTTILFRLKCELIKNN